MATNEEVSNGVIIGDLSSITQNQDDDSQSDSLNECCENSSKVSCSSIEEYKNSHKIGHRKASEGIITYNEPWFQTIVNTMYEKEKSTKQTKKRSNSEKIGSDGTPINQIMVNHSLGRSVSCDSGLQKRILALKKEEMQGSSVKKKKKEEVNFPKYRNKRVASLNAATLCQILCENDRKSRKIENGKRQSKKLCVPIELTKTWKKGESDSEENIKMKIHKNKSLKGEKLHLTSELSESSQAKKKFPMKKKMIKEEILEKKTKKLTLQRAKKILNSRKMHKDKMESKQKKKKFKKKENSFNNTVVRRKRGDTCCAARTHVNVTPKRLYRGGWYECYQPPSYCPNQGPALYWSNNDIIDHNSAGTSRDSESSAEDKATSIVDVTGPYTVPRLQMLESSPYINTLMPHGLGHISSVCQVCNCAHSSMLQAAQCQTFTLGGVGSLSNVQVLPPYSVSSAFTCSPPHRSSFSHCSCPACCTAGGYYSSSGTPIIHDPIVLHHPVPLQLSHTESGIQNIVKSDQSEYVDVVDSQSDDSKLSVISSMKSTSCDLKKAFKTVKPKDPNKIKAIKSKNEKIKDAQKLFKSKKLKKKDLEEMVKPKLKKSKNKLKNLKPQKTEHFREENEKKPESQNSEYYGNSGKETEIIKEKNERKKSRGNEEDIEKKVKAKKKVLAHGWKWYGEPEIRTMKKPDGQTVTRKCYPAIKHDKDDIIQVRDCVLVCSGPRPKDIPFVAKISNFWEEVDNGEMMMTLLWYYRPEHTEAGRKPQHLENELFACRHWDETTLACIEDKGYVLTYNEYCRYMAEVCRSRCNFPPRPKVVPDPEEGYREQGRPPTDIDPDNVLLCRQVYDLKLRRVLKNPS